MPLYTFIHSLLNVLVQIANKMGLQKKWHSFTNYLAYITFKLSFLRADHLCYSKSSKYNMLQKILKKNSI
jgi:hypothetical protein